MGGGALRTLVPDCLVGTHGADIWIPGQGAVPSQPPPGTFAHPSWLPHTSASRGLTLCPPVTPLEGPPDREALGAVAAVGVEMLKMEDRKQKCKDVRYRTRSCSFIFAEDWLQEPSLHPNPKIRGCSSPFHKMEWCLHVTFPYLYPTFARRPEPTCHFICMESALVLDTCVANSSFTFESFWTFSLK